MILLDNWQILTKSGILYCRSGTIFEEMSGMSTLKVSLPPAMKAFVAAQVHSGLYSSASDYMQTLIRADQHRRAEATLEAQLLDSLASDEDASHVSPSAYPGAASPTEGRTIVLPLPPTTAVADWLHTLGLVSPCQWDVLLCLSRHQNTLLGAADLARLLGYASTAIVVALDVLETLALVERSQVSQGARLYRCLVLHTAPRREALTQLQTLAAHRAGRVVIAQQLRQDHTPKGAAQQAQPFLTKSQERAARKQRWLKAI
jgi:putative addiction module CopG family antidote